jgi:hypothetical protein
MRWVGHVARMGRMTCAHKLYRSEDVKEGDHFEVLDVRGKIILKWDAGRCTGFIWLRIGTSGGLL